MWFAWVHGKNIGIRTRIQVFLSEFQAPSTESYWQHQQKQSGTTPWDTKATGVPQDQFALAEGAVVSAAKQGNLQEVPMRRKQTATGLYKGQHMPVQDEAGARLYLQCCQRRPGGRREELKPLGANIQKAATSPFPQWRLHQNGEEDALGKILTCDCYEGMDILTTDRLFSVRKRNRGLLVFLLLVTEEINRTVQNFNQGGSA